jgi:Transcriptional regulator, AbiEi antitoxin
MYSPKTQKEQVLDIVKKMGVVRVSDLTARGLHHESLRRLCRDGLLIKSEVYTNLLMLMLLNITAWFRSQNKSLMRSSAC